MDRSEQRSDYYTLEDYERELEERESMKLSQTENSDFSEVAEFQEI